MQSLLEDLWLYQKNQDSRALAEVEVLLAAEDESTRRQAATVSSGAYWQRLRSMTFARTSGKAV